MATSLESPTSSLQRGKDAIFQPFSNTPYMEMVQTKKLHIPTLSLFLKYFQIGYIYNRGIYLAEQGAVVPVVQVCVRYYWPGPFQNVGVISTCAEIPVCSCFVHCI